ncbi:[Fructose-bisphosphate aldolase]-lysine N-methyltransferase [Handroanthus impetiginosus]|uniref:[Fructose-bisphosphate aldolase]-lysine N-methyltransferase n=1 Tax=Handroanthus impetiginosus TaxID=429701 RepID=A0A2G9H991_9LAMI|nr:[Fructose-bisphosphate aldolase]-lysine N-methyltransferase [Handroanthus impetiginosus]
MDVGKHENDDEFTVVLELAETDPLFEKKKKLLRDMGFDPVCSVSIKSSSSPEQLKDFLNVLLQRARLINFNEVELYFGGDVINLGDCSSPRNELEAFHSLLEVIDKLVADQKYTFKSTQKNLRDEIIDRINEVGSKFNEETKIVRDSSCDKEKCLLDWCVDNGVKTKLDIAYVEGAGRGALSKEDLKVGDIALEIPVSVIISEELLYESDMFPIFEKIDGISEETMMLLWSMKEKHNKNSRFKLYFDALPEKFNTGLSFGIDAIMVLDGTLLLEEIVQAKEKRRMFLSLYGSCILVYVEEANVFISIRKYYLLEEANVFISLWQIDKTTNSLKFPLSRACHSGEQCFLSYGNFSNSHLLTFYGFLSQGDNPFDVISLVCCSASDIDVAWDEDPESGPPTSEWSSHMVRGTWLSKNH